MERFKKFFSILICFLMVFCCFFSNSKKTYADLKDNGVSKNIKLSRSLESMMDVDYQTWQLIVYPSSNLSKDLILRIVGYPGSLRMDHPTNLIIHSGIKNWVLKDITKKSKVQFGVINDSAAEFDLTPLISQLDKNRPLKISIPGLISELSIPPFLVSEWRELGE